MTRPRTAAVALALLLALLAPAAARAQDPAQALPAFVQRVAELWERGDAEGLAALAPRGGRILLDLPGEDSPGEVQPRNAAAALRRLFGQRETVGVRPSGATVSGGSPLQAFGELGWTARARGVSETMYSVVYVGAVLENGRWRLRELRVLR